MSEAILDDSGERMVPEFHKGLIGYAEHLQRYQSAVQLCRGKVVLDIASGSGYGSALLATSAKKVQGVDVSPEAVEYARATYAGENVEFTVGSATEIPLGDDSVDVVVTFETIEHVEDYRTFVREIRRVLKPGGIAVVSTPNDLEYEEGNHFHLHEFVRDELVDLLRADFPHIDEYYQATWRYVALDRLDALGDDETDRRTVNLAPLRPEQMRYFYFLCSDRPLTAKIEPMGALGEHYSEREQMELHRSIAGLHAELAATRNSRTYRLARRIGRLAHPFRR
jgi:ubiquinone/menaquinone biosynthesis C-methylase UbiE